MDAYLLRRLGSAANGRGMPDSSCMVPRNPRRRICHEAQGEAAKGRNRHSRPHRPATRLETIRGTPQDTRQGAGSRRSSADKSEHNPGVGCNTLARCIRSREDSPSPRPAPKGSPEAPPCPQNLPDAPRHRPIGSRGLLPDMLVPLVPRPASGMLLLHWRCPTNAVVYSRRRQGSQAMKTPKPTASAIRHSSMLLGKWIEYVAPERREHLCRLARECPAWPVDHVAQHRASSEQANHAEQAITREEAAP